MAKTANVVLGDVEGPVATVEIVKVGTGDVKWAMLRKVVHLVNSLPVSVAGSAEAVAPLLPRSFTGMSQ